jgi:hypothetical protein
MSGFCVQHEGMFGKLYRLVCGNSSRRKWKTTSRWAVTYVMQMIPGRPIVGGILSLLKSKLCILHDRKSAIMLKSTVTGHIIDNMYWAQTKNNPFHIHCIFLVQPTISRSNGFLTAVTETVTVCETLKTNLSLHSWWTVKVSLQLHILHEQQ